ncbi:MAG: RNA polymerase sigma factor [Chloroflexi bacterium]|nr:MAG: RNA polymerase sigma factor [Chloroflexota bacterium]
MTIGEAAKSTRNQLRHIRIGIHYQLVRNLLTSLRAGSTISVLKPRTRWHPCRHLQPVNGFQGEKPILAWRAYREGPMSRSAVIGTDENELIALAAGGDREAYGRLYERHSLRVFRHAYFLTGDPLLAEDITAQVFLNALEAIPRYQDRGVPFVAWLLRITGNLVINFRKSPKNNGHSQLPETAPALDPGSSPEHSAECKVDGQRIWRQVGKLPYEQRQVIVMRFIDDLGYPDIAQMLGKSVGAVRVIQFRALHNLRDLMQNDRDYARRQQLAG